MNNEIKSSSDATSVSASLLLGSLDNYCSIKINTIAPLSEVPGSFIHDSIGPTIESALSTWSCLLESDASAIMATGAEFDGIDSKLARNLLGLGGS